MDLFKGRYGFDKLSTIILLIGVLLLLWRGTIAFGIIAIGFAFWRAYSKDIFTRKSELYKFEGWISRSFKGGQGNGGSGSFRETFRYYKEQAEKYIYQKKNYKIVKCEKCGQKLRLPRGKGKITATCRRCGYEFKMKT
ncbi:hypothetical protein [Clostridium polynesiense]|uniref:hypothetical protein n=1 Tax=Clostridium polynesiense TaxID=1325933 RepID=UPI00058E0BC9|nr:hypothetical protein [Clostridium polynesiense]